MKSVFVCLLLFLLFTSHVFAQEALKIPPMTVTPTPTIEYTLPYPGILPNNPLYGLKALRDRVVSYFIADSQKRAEFDLLQADKRLQAGLFLLHQEKPDMTLAVSTISKGQNYFEEAITALEEAKKVKDESVLTDISDRLLRSAQKQHELLVSEARHANDEDKEALASLVKRSEHIVSEMKKHHPSSEM